MHPAPPPERPSRVVLVREDQDIPEVLIHSERASWRRAYAIGARADGLTQRRARQLAYACFPSTVDSSARSTWAGRAAA